MTTEHKGVHSRPTKRETQRRIAKPRSITSETSRHGEPSGHLAKGSHDHEDDETDDGVRDEDRARASLRKGLSSADNETSTNGASNGNGGGGSMRLRRGSMSSGSTESPGGESAIDETGEAAPPSAGGSSPFARRMSFGARAMWDARGGMTGT